MKLRREWHVDQRSSSAMESRTHSVEIEAYGAVLRAFMAQSDVLSWGKAELISELRKELRVSDYEHREILAKVNADESIKALQAMQKEDKITREPETVRRHPSKKLKRSAANMSSPAVPMISKEREDQETPSNLAPDIIEIHATEELINEVERVCRGENPDPVQVQRAKTMLKDHERALVQAIARLARISTDDGSNFLHVSTF
ncbi:uncharacterized protein LOC144708065 [Wolffia australiana]